MLRAISDVVLVGTETVKFDNPRLTTRLVKGPNPIRIVLDKNNIIKDSCYLLNNADNKGFKIISDKFKSNKNNTLLLPIKNNSFDISDIISLIENLGKSIIFIEGGGKLISFFYKNAKLDRLHLCISPTIIGKGLNSFSIDKNVKLNENRCKQISYLKMGDDILCNIKLSS